MLRRDYRKGKFGIGDYELNSIYYGTPSKMKMQTFFIERVICLVPEVSDELDKELLDLYKQIPEFYYGYNKRRSKDIYAKRRLIWYDDKRLPWNYIENRWISNTPFKNPLINTFVQKIFDWSRSHNLDEMWFREHAFETLDLWSLEESLREKKYWQPFPYILGLPFWDTYFHPVYSAPKFIFEFQADLLGKGYKGVIKSEVKKAFNKQLDEYFEGLEREAVNRGMKKPKQKYKLEHFDWLVDYQVKEKPYGEIEAEVNINSQISLGKSTYLSDDTKKVRVAIPKLAKDLDLSTLRPEDRIPGRRSKKLKTLQ